MIALLSGLAPAATLPATLQEAHPVQLVTPVVHSWSAEAPAVEDVVLVVLTADATALEPLPAATPVLQCDGWPVARLNDGHLDGAVVGWIPGPLPEAGLTCFLGAPALPESLDADARARRLVEAQAAGLSATRAATTHPPTRLADAPALRRRAAEWIEAWAPGEQHVAERLRIPVINAQ